MKMQTDECEPALVSQFYDGELDPEKSRRVEAHLGICPECTRMLGELKRLSGRVKDHIAGDPGLDSRVGSVEAAVNDRIRRKDSTQWETFLASAFSKKAWIPAAAIASLTLILFTLLRTPGVSEPSAIITSLSGETSSVIIMETPETGHTILWFTEAS